MKSVICYINQFLASIGDEDKADYGPEIRDDVTGPTAAINQMLAEIDAQVTTTIVCGDDFMNTHKDETTERILAVLEGGKFNLLLAGPASQAGHYRVVCGEIGEVVSARFGVPVITSMHAENPSVEMFKKDMYAMTGSHSAASMKKDAGTMVELADKLLKGQTLGRPDAGDYYARGIRHRVWYEDGMTIVDRTVGMLITRATGQPHQSELIISKRDLTPVAPALKGLKHARIVLINTSGIVPADNPDGIRSISATHWDRYDISKMNRLAGGEFKIIHAGFNSATASADPNVTMSVDAMKELLSEDKYDSPHDYFCLTVGARTTQGEAERMAEEIIPLLRENYVDAIITAST